MVMAGKGLTAPCGHEGRYVSQTIIICLKGCDDVPAIARAKTEPVADPGDEDEYISYCPQCMSEDTEEYKHPFSSVTQTHMHCWDCGTVWQVF